MTTKELLRAYVNELGMQRAYSYRQLNRYAKKGQIVFAGSSLMEQFPMEELRRSMGIEPIIYNRGIGGFTTADYAAVLEDCVLDLEPSKVFINIGSNDMARDGFSVESLTGRYKEILQRIQQRVPDCQIYVMAYYPINDKDEFPKICSPQDFTTRNNDTIRMCNQAVEKMAQELGCQYIDVTQDLFDEKGCLKKEYSKEGLHMWPDAYAKVFKRLEKYL